MSEKQKWIFNICPYISVLPTPFSFKLALLCTQHKAARLRLALLNMSAGFSGHLPERMLGAWRPGSEGDWVSVSSITGASFKLMHNRASQSTSSLIVTSLLPVQGGEWEPKPKEKKKKQKRSEDREGSQGYIPLLLLFTLEVLWVCVTA